MQPEVLYSTVLRCRLTGSHKSSKIKTGVSCIWCPTCTVDWHNTSLLVTSLNTTYVKCCLNFKNVRQIILILKHFGEVTLKSDTFPGKINCWTCALDQCTFLHCILKLNHFWEIDKNFEQIFRRFIQWVSHKQKQPNSKGNTMQLQHCITSPTHHDFKWKMFH